MVVDISFPDYIPETPWAIYFKLHTLTPQRMKMCLLGAVTFDLL